MSKADKIAMRIKGQPLLKDACEIEMSPETLEVLRANPDPCDPPDLAGDMPMSFCGVPIRIRLDWCNENRIALVIPLP